MLTLKEMDAKIKLQKSTNAEAQTQFHVWYGALSSADKEQFDQYHKRKKFFTRFVLGLIVLFLIAGFQQYHERNAQRNSSTPVTPAPTVATIPQNAPAKQAPIKTEYIDQAATATMNELKNPQNYPLVRDVYISDNHEKKEVIIALVVNGATNKKAALELADTAIRRFSSNAVHNGSFTMPTVDSYGSLFDTYAIHIAVAPDYASNDPSKFLYEQYIMPGMHTKQGPDWKNAR